MDIPQERKLVTEVPGPKSREWFERRAKAVPQGVFNIHPIVTARASGAIIEDVDGNRLIDFATGIAVLNVGHTSPEVVAAAQRQLELDTHSCFHVTANEPYIELAERLNAIAPGDFEKKTMFANSGAEAVENAVKVARRATGRQAIVTFDHAFHGRTLLAMSLTAKVMPYKQGMGPFAPEIYRLPFAYPYRWPGGAERCAEEALDYAREEIHKHIGEENVAAVILEPIQGEGGFIVPAPGFVRALRSSAPSTGSCSSPTRSRAGWAAPAAVRDRGRGRPARPHHEREVARWSACRSAPSRGGLTSWTRLPWAASAGHMGATRGCRGRARGAGSDREGGLLERSRTLGENVRGRLGEMQERNDVIRDVRGRGMITRSISCPPRHQGAPERSGWNAIVRRCLEEGVVILKAGTYDNVILLLRPHDRRGSARRGSRDAGRGHRRSPDNVAASNTRRTTANAPSATKNSDWGGVGCPPAKTVTAPILAPAAGPNVAIGRTLPPLVDLPSRPPMAGVGSGPPAIANVGGCPPRRRSRLSDARSSGGSRSTSRRFERHGTFGGCGSGCWRSSQPMTGTPPWTGSAGCATWRHGTAWTLPSSSCAGARSRPSTTRSHSSPRRIGPTPACASTRST